MTTPKPPPREVVEACALIHRGGRLLVLKRGPGRLWAGFWEFPTVHVSGADPGGRSAEQGGAVDLATGVARMTGLAIQVAAKPVLSVDYTVTRHRVRLNAFEADARGESLTLVPGFVEGAWIAPGELAALHFSAAGRRLVAWVSRCETGGGSSPV